MLSETNNSRRGLVTGAVVFNQKFSPCQSPTQERAVGIYPSMPFPPYLQSPACDRAYCRTQMEVMESRSLPMGPQGQPPAAQSRVKKGGNRSEKETLWHLGKRGTSVVGLVWRGYGTWYLKSCPSISTPGPPLGGRLLLLMDSIFLYTLSFTFLNWSCRPFFQAHKDRKKVGC